MGYWAAEVDLLPLSGSGRQLTLLNEKRGHEYMNPVGTLSKSSQVEEKIAVRPDNPRCPIRLQSVPLEHELQTAPEEMSDPCGENKNSPVHGLVHRYPDRVLFLVNEMCAMYCRYCTRSRMVGDGNRTLSMDTYDKAFEYIRAHKK